MTRDELLARIWIDPKRCFGKPCIRGHRIWVSLVPDLYDNEDGVLYFYAEDDVPCAGGRTATAAMLMCVNCKGNADKKPAGSGWVVVMLDAGEAGAQKAGIYGCRFDQNGQPTAFAAATIDERNDDIVIAVAAER